jgi:hypothetical protein
MYTVITLSNPKNPRQFWERIIEAAGAIEADFHGLRFETKRQALKKKYESTTDPSAARLDSLHVIGYQRSC